MANEINWAANPALVAYLSSGLDALANDARAIGAAIDNSTALDIYMDLELRLAAQSGARSAGARVDIYLVSSLDGGTNYGYGDAALTPAAHALIWSFALDAAVTARYVTSKPLGIGPGHHKLLLVNNTGQALAGTLNTLKYRVYSEEIQ